MNKEYLYINGKCIIYDENGAILEDDGKVALKEYSDKLDQILVQENVIETLEDELDETNNLIDKNEKSMKSDKTSIWFCTGLLCLFPILFQQLLPHMITKESLAELMTNGHARTLIQGLLLSLNTILGGGFILGLYNSYKDKKRKLNGNKTKKEAIEKSLVQEKQKLEELEKTKQKTHLEEEMCSKKVNDLQSLRNLRDNLRAYYGCGYNRKKYERYLKAGKLEKKLQKYYSQDEIELIKENLEEGYIRKLK